MATGYSSQDDLVAILTSCSSPQLRESATWQRSSGGGVSLPPLRRSGEPLEAGMDSTFPADSSPLRRTRKAELISCVLGHSPGSQGPQTGLLLELELKEQQLAIKQQHRSGKIMLEGWVDDVLTNSQLQQQTSKGTIRGAAAAAGLSRQQLLAAGLSAGNAEQLYRCLYVHSVGFVDTIKELLSSNEHKQELLQAVWRAFLVLAEHCMKATFKSDYMELVTAAGTAMTELLCAKQALSEVQRDNAVMVKDLGNLSAAEAEASAQRSTLKAQVAELRSALATEQTAHKRAIQQYVDTMDANSQLQIQLSASAQAFAQLSAAHEDLDQQHQRLQQQYSGLVAQCKVVRDICKHVDEALALDPQLARQVQQWQPANHPQAAAGVAETSNSGATVSEHVESPQQPLDGQQQQQPQAQQPIEPSEGAEPADDDASNLQAVAEKLEQQMQAMYAAWRVAGNERDVALTERFRMADQLRDAKEVNWQLEQQHKALQQVLQETQQQLSDSQAEVADLNKRLAAAHESLAQTQLDLTETQASLQAMQDKAAELENRCSQLDNIVEQLHDEAKDQQAVRIKLEAQLTAAAQRLGEKHRLMSEISKGFAVAMQSLAANQTARAVADRLLKAEKAKGAHMNSSLNSKDKLLHDLQAQVRDQAHQLTKLHSEAQLLDSSLQESQRQAMALGTRLTMSENKNDELIGQNQTQMDQLAEAATKINKLITKLEQTKQQLERAQKEVKDLKEAAQVTERIISDGRLLAKSLTADVERITREKQVAQERAETTKARLELEVQRLSGELSSSERKLELLASDLAAERDRVVAQAALLERKRGKKRHWKEAYHTSADEVVALHTQLLAKHKDLEVLEGHLNQLHTELVMLTINSGGAVQQEQRPGSQGRSRDSSRPVSRGLVAPAAPADTGSRPASRGIAGAASTPPPVDLAAARQAHACVVEQLARLQEQCAAMDAQIEENEAETQAILLGLVNPALTSQQIKADQATVAERRTQLHGLRQQREMLAKSRDAAAAELRKAEAVLRNAHYGRLQQHQKLLEQQAMQATDLINAAAMAQLAAAEEAELSVRAALTQQVTAFEGLQADKAALAQRMQDLQAGIETFMNRIHGLEGDKAHVEEQLKRTQQTVACLQAEVSAVNNERERIRSNAAQAEQRVTALENELETAKQAVTMALKGMEAKQAAERQLQEQRLVAERNKAAKVSESAEAAVSALKGRIKQLRTALIDLSTYSFSHACISAADKTPLLDRESTSTSGSRSNTAGSRSSGGGGAGGTNNSSSEGRGVPLLPLGGPDQQQQLNWGPGLSAGLGPKAVSAVGERWLYMHLPQGPWRKARQLLLQPQQEVPDGLMRQSSSVPSTPRADATRILGLPPTLPGLTFNLEGLVSFIGELLLYKIDSDTAIDDRMLMCTAATAAGLGTASSSTASSRAPSRPTTAPTDNGGSVGSRVASSLGSNGVTGSGSSGGNNGGGSRVNSAVSAAGSLAAAATAGALLGVVPEEEGQMGGAVRGGTAAAVAAWWATRFRRDLEGAVFNYFLSRCGSRLLAEAHCSALVVALRKVAGRSKRVHLFGRCLGLLEPVVPPAGVAVLVHFMAHLHSTCGPLVTEATDGSSQVLARTAAQLAMQVMQPTATPPCAELSGLTAAITAAAGGSSDNAVDVDTVLELLLLAWTAQREAEQQQLERVAGQADTRGKGLANQEEFSSLAKQMAPAAGHHLHPEQLNWLFAAAIAASGPGALAVTPAGFAAAVLDAGLVGSAAHVRRHPTISSSQRPQYSDYRLLTTSWQAVKPCLREVLRVLPKTQPALAPEVTAVTAMAQKLDEAITACSPAAEAWQTYRRILGFYSHYGSFPEGGSVVNTPRPDSMSGTPRTQVTMSAEQQQQSVGAQPVG